MVIQFLELWNYRNYNKFEVEFHPGINFIYGKNGQGKTNLIESVYFLTHLRSFRTPKVQNLYSFDQNAATIQTRLLKGSVSHEVRICLHQNQKRVFIDQKTLNYSSEYIKNFFSLLFAPDLLAAFKEYPMERRNFFDRVLVFTDQSYFRWLKEFNRIKKQKNHLLRAGDGGQVSIWNQMLANVLPGMIQARKGLVEKINQTLPAIFTELTGREDKLQLFYRNDFEDKANSDEKSILEFLNGKLDSELRKGFMLYGPHKDDFWMTINGKKDKLFFSQGEYRISFLALQLALNQMISDVLRFSPVILLDDIFSELDEDVFGKTLNYIAQKENQVFITSTTIPKNFMELGKGFHISNGKLLQ